MVPIILFYHNNLKEEPEKKSMIELSVLPVSYEGKTFFQSCIYIYRHHDLSRLLDLNWQDFVTYDLFLLMIPQYLLEQTNDSGNSGNESIKDDISLISKGFCDFISLSAIQTEKFVESNNLKQILIQNGVEFETNSPFLGYIGADTPTKEDNETPIIAFCTDIKESVNRIETDGENAFNQYCYYIDNVADFYIKQLELSSEEVFSRSNLWVPGDALWGLANSKTNASLKSEIIEIFSRIISAIAYGLTLTNKWSNNQAIPPLEMRGAAFYGQILKKSLSNKYFLYNGRCLNACGRIQEAIKPNSMVFGFVFSQFQDPAKQRLLDFFNVELPEIEFSSVAEQITRMSGQLPESGCGIKLQTVRTEENTLLLHFVTYPTKNLKGLEDTVIIATKVDFQIDEENNTIRIDSQEEGLSYRKEYLCNPFEVVNLFDLITDNKLGYLKEIYSKDNNIAIRFNNDTNNFILEFKGESHCPKIINERRVLDRSRIIDFSKHKYCILPVYKAAPDLARGKAILIYTKNMGRDKERAIMLTEISSSDVNDIENYNYYYNSTDLCIKYIIGFN
jgi:hypothetical protein